MQSHCGASHIANMGGRSAEAWHHIVITPTWTTSLNNYVSSASARNASTTTFESSSTHCHTITTNNHKLLVLIDPWAHGLKPRRLGSSRALLQVIRRSSALGFSDADFSNGWVRRAFATGIYKLWDGKALQKGSEGLWCRGFRQLHSRRRPPELSTLNTKLEFVSLNNLGWKKSISRGSPGLDTPPLCAGRFCPVKVLAEANPTEGRVSRLKAHSFN